ncbi:SCAN domain-containing protein 3-like [Octopus sinensis]|uniref:SCAN domain-containing protein 3-like n=1 Tax=Octopus sinensis TaxID=2607531 RepID=A0A6P7TIG6_9MOLL|nr:SCAN domain-containing protein 3-like [Octopus sinensis]
MKELYPAINQPHLSNLRQNHCPLKPVISAFDILIELKKFHSIPEKAQSASYKIDQLLAKKKKACSDAKNIILPALEIAVGTMVSDEVIKQIKTIPLSAHTISRKIQDISCDIDDQFREHFIEAKRKLENSRALQIDASTDTSSKAQLISFLRIIRGGKIICQFFFCCELKERTTVDVFNSVRQNVVLRGSSGKLVLPLILMVLHPYRVKKKKGFVADILQKHSQVENIRCMILREVLVSKSRLDCLLKTMDNVFKVVNYIKSHSLRCRLFASLCETMDSDFKCLLLHTEAVLESGLWRNSEDFQTYFFYTDYGPDGVPP